MRITFKRLHPNAILPTYGSADAIGMDLHARIDESIHIKPGKRARIPIGLSAEFPKSHYMRLAPRSGLGDRHGIDLLGGVIDPDYRGEIAVLALNTGDKTLEITPGMRIAQGVMERADRMEIAEADTLGETTRGEGGFGSTGV